MNEVLQEYLGRVNNLQMLEAKNLPHHLMVSMSTMDSEELFKVCTQLFILKNNIPTENKIVNLSEDEILAGATQYAKEILNRIQNKPNNR